MDRGAYTFLGDAINGCMNLVIVAVACAIGLGILAGYLIFHG